MSYRHFLPFQQKPVSSNLPFLPSYHIHLYHLSLAFKYHEDLEFKTRTGNYFDIVTSSWDEAGISHPTFFLRVGQRPFPLHQSAMTSWTPSHGYLPASMWQEQKQGSDHVPFPAPPDKSPEISGRSPSPCSPKAGDVTGDSQLRRAARTWLLRTDTCEIRRRSEKQHYETQRSTCSGRVWGAARKEPFSLLEDTDAARDPPTAVPRE